LYYFCDNGKNAITITIVVLTPKPSRLTWIFIHLWLKKHLRTSVFKGWMPSQCIT